MNDISLKIEGQISSLDKKIASLSGNYLTNTWKRQQEQKNRDRQIEQFRQQKQMLEYLNEEVHQRELTAFEKNLLVGAFYEDMRHSLNQKRYAEEHRSYTVTPVQFPTRDEQQIKRLQKAGIYSKEDLISAVAKYEALMQKATIPPNPATARIRDLTFQARLSQKGDIQFTPIQAVRQLIEIATIDGSSRVLEPEAGIGSIADEVKKITPHVDCIEPCWSFRELLELKGHILVGNDLFECEPQPVYDAVLMNPPFSEECRHIRYAFEFVKPGGVLVAICCLRMAHSDQKKYREFGEWLTQRRFRFEELAAKFEMTGTNTQILVISK